VGASQWPSTVFLVVGLSASAHAQELSLPNGDASEAVLRQHERRPAALIPLYASFIALEALDIHSTRSALAQGAVEANPAVRGLTGSSLGMVTVKAAGTAGLIFASEKMWRKNKAAAIVLMIATNSAMAWVVEHNYRVAR
jgi:Domain of unknown function (DUF5658)